jgi:hypothetical protein
MRNRKGQRHISTTTYVLQIRTKDFLGNYLKCLLVFLLFYFFLLAMPRKLLFRDERMARSEVILQTSRHGPLVVRGYDHRTLTIFFLIWNSVRAREL